jgi:hypothetical protein
MQNVKFLVKKSELFKIESLDKMIQEAGELANIIARSVVTAKKKKLS